MSTSPDRPRPRYQHHAGFYRSLVPEDDFSKPWEASPDSFRSLPVTPFKPIFPLPNDGQQSANNSLSSTSTVVVTASPKKRGLWSRIFRFMISGKTHEEGPLPVKPPNPYSEKVPLNEWKQYGYWARPFLNNVQCKNSPVTSEKSITTEELADLVTKMRSEVDPDFEWFPERWIVGAKHRALPQRPARWKDPDPDLPLPFPWEVQLNPLLYHLLWGPSPMSWCIWDDPKRLLFHKHTPFAVPCVEPDRAQPATWPFLTCMHFNAVHGDDAFHFPWAFTAYNPKGLKVGDVLSEIHRNFSQSVTEAEFSSWPSYRQEAARRCHQGRINRHADIGIPSEDYMRRWDALGARMYFRGIEPSVDGGGWMIVFGPY